VEYFGCVKEQNREIGCCNRLLGPFAPKEKQCRKFDNLLEEMVLALTNQQIHVLYSPRKA
jgi:hypothetical protein